MWSWRTPTSRFRNGRKSILWYWIWRVFSFQRKKNSSQANYLMHHVLLFSLYMSNWSLQYLEPIRFSFLSSTMWSWHTHWPEVNFVILNLVFSKKKSSKLANYLLPCFNFLYSRYMSGGSIQYLELIRFNFSLFKIIRKLWMIESNTKLSNI